MEKRTSDKLNRFFSRYPSQKYKKGEVIIRCDDESLPFVYFLEKGFVKQYSYSGSGEEVIFNIYRPYAYFPIIYVLNSIPNKYAYEAVTEVRLRKVPSAEMVSFLKKESDVLFDLACRLGRGIDALLGMSEFLKGAGSKNKVISVFAILASKFGEPMEEGQIRILLPVGHKDIASIAGLTRETVTRQMEQLKAKGLVRKVKGSLIVSDLKMLESLL